MTKKIVVCSNSISFGIEIDQRARDISELRLLARAMTEPHKNAWPAQLKNHGFEVTNLSAPLSGFYQNVSRAIIHFSETTNPSHHYLIDVSYIGHAPVDTHPFRSPPFFKPGSEQYKAYRDLTEERIVHGIGATAKILKARGLQFSFFATLEPYKTMNLDELSRDDFAVAHQQYASFIRSLERHGNRLAPHPEIDSLFLHDQSFASFLREEKISNYTHPINAEAHAEIAALVAEKLRRREQDQ